MNRSTTLLIVGVVLLGCLAICCILAVTGAFVMYGVSRPVSSISIEGQPALGGPGNSGDNAPRNIPTQTPQWADGGQVAAVPTDTLHALENTLVPINDLIEIAGRLKGLPNIAPTVPAPSPAPQVGDQKKFWVVNSNDNQNSQVSATLRYITEHVYFWIQDDVEYEQDDLQKLVDTFEKKIYPTNREFFGSEWIPGVDSDPHLYILYTRGMGGNVAGYFSSQDEYPPQANEYSNAHEMFLLSADLVTLQEEYAYGVLAHEFQHMIHWYRDRNEETWMNEGFADLAMFLNQYDIGGADQIYVGNPDIQLNDWPTQDDQRTAHYGAAFLFLDYFLDRFGENMTKAILADPMNGFLSMDNVLAQSSSMDQVTGQPISADDVFVDWVVASFLQDKNVGDGRYTYHNYPQAPRPAVTKDIRSCPLQPQESQVSQYGVHYIQIDCKGDYTLHFSGSLEVGVVPASPHSGNYAFWSNKGDESDMTLTRTFDFTSVSGPIEMNYWTWYEIEKDYDYVYLEASVDGQNWEILKPPACTRDNPAGNSYGCGYNNASGGDEAGGGKWIEEKVDLSAYAGKQVQLRFEYITDAAVNGDGFLLDDLSIPQIQYSSDFEKDQGGWQAQGFVRLRNVLPQSFRVTLIRQGRNTTVQTVELSANNTADIPLQIGGDVKNVVVVISGTTRFTRQKAAYRLSISK